MYLTFHVVQFLTAFVAANFPTFPITSTSCKACTHQVLCGCIVFALCQCKCHLSNTGTLFAGCTSAPWHILTCDANKCFPDNFIESFFFCFFSFSLHFLCSRSANFGTLCTLPIVGKKQLRVKT